MSDLEPDQEGLRAARRLAGWEIGDPGWADIILAAYMNPERTNARLDAYDAPQMTGAGL